MGINDLLKHLPGSAMSSRRHSFFNLQLKGHVVPFVAAGPLWQFASSHAADFLRGNHIPALIKWTRFLSHLRSICKWQLRVFMDGMDNVHKAPENECRENPWRPHAPGAI